VLGVPRADIGEFAASVTLVSSRAVLGRFVAHSRAIADDIVLKMQW